MKIINIIKRQQLLLLAIILIIVTALGVTYAVFVNILSNNDNQVVTTADLSVTYSDNCSILTGDISALTDQQGLAQTGCTISFTNNSTTNLAYNINLYNNPPENNTNELLDLYNVKVSIDDSTPFRLGTYPDRIKNGVTMKEVYQRVIAVDETVSHNIKVWISTDTPATESDKYIYLNAKVISTNTEAEVNSGSINKAVQVINDQSILGVIDTGDEIAIGTEHFYVVANDGTNVTMLAKYNLLVGYQYDGADVELISSVTGIQDSTAIGAHYSEGTKTNEYPSIGTVAFSSNNYWVLNNSLNNVYGDNFPAYVYDENSNIYQYIENYKEYLGRFSSNIINSRLLSYEELLELGCTTTCPDNFNWLYGSSYWTGTANGKNNIYLVHSSGTVSNYIYSNSASYGVRPVIEIATSDIQI